MSNKERYTNVLSVWGIDVLIRSVKPEGFDEAEDFLKVNSIASLRASEKRPVKNVIQAFLTRPETLEYIEKLMLEHQHQEFNGTKFSTIKTKRKNKQLIFVTATQLTDMGVTCIQVERGKHGGVWFHHLLAMELARWVDAKFAYEFDKDYTRLKLFEANNCQSGIDVLYDAIRAYVKDNGDKMAKMIQDQYDLESETAVKSDLQTAIVDLSNRILDQQSKEPRLMTSKRSYLERIRAQFLKDIDEGRVYQKNGIWYRDDSPMLIIPKL